MKLCSWNVRGLNEATKRRMVRDGISMSSCDIVGLHETKLCSPTGRRLRAIGGSRIKAWSCLDSIESRGGVLVGWSDDFSHISSHVGIFSVSVVLNHRPSNWSFLFSSVYAPTDYEDREVCWWELKRVRGMFAVPWVLCGDFNVTLSPSERSGRSGSLRDIDSFRNLVDCLQLIDLPLHGRKFTWSNHRITPTLARLDRFLISQDWDTHFPNSIQCSIPTSCSDHCLLSLDTGGIPPPPPLFRFEKFWLLNPDFIPFVHNCWSSFSSQGNPTFSFVQKLKLIRRRMKWWKKNIVGSLFKEKRNILMEIDSLNKIEESRPLTNIELEKREDLRTTYSSSIREEETYWQQRSRIQWLKEGDENTTFFHSIASHHRRKNFIPSIFHSGRLLVSESDKVKAFHDHFQNLFSSMHTSPLTINWTSLYLNQPMSLSHLDDPFSEEEIKSAIFSMNANKSPGPDGLFMLFYQTFWETLKPDLLSMFNHLYSDPSSIHKLNRANICLIPKSPEACFTKDFRPISLLNYIFKIFTKVLANRCLRGKSGLLPLSCFKCWYQLRCLQQHSNRRK